MRDTRVSPEIAATERSRLRFSFGPVDSLGGTESRLADAASLAKEEKAALSFPSHPPRVRITGLPSASRPSDNLAAASDPTAKAPPLMKLILAPFLGFLLALALPGQDSGTSYLFQLAPGVTESQRLALQSLDVLPGEAIRVVVQPQGLHDFRSLFPNAVLIDRGRPFREVKVDQMLGGPEMPPSEQRYFTMAEINQAMADLAAQFPDIAEVVNLSNLPGGSQTHEGRSIFALKVSNRVANDEDQPAIVIAAQHHCRELNAPVMVIGAMRRLLASSVHDSILSRVIYQNEIYFVPTVNPDGVAHVWAVDNFWRKNRRNNGDGTFGVDINRNYPTRWGACGSVTTTSSDIYRGPAPASEPEVQTMRALMAHVRPEIYIDFHSSGQEVLFTYPPCVTPALTTTARSFIQGYADDLAAQMDYATRGPSASGEAPEDFWQNGALSFLIEVGTEFQPAFEFTEREEMRVWPGLRHVLTTWDPALRGHVVSAVTGLPIEARITVGPGLFGAGESTFSRARDGRYGVWLPVGSWQVTFSAPGFMSLTRSVVVDSLDHAASIEVDMQPTASLGLSVADTSASSTELTLHSPQDPGSAYWIALSSGSTPGIRLGERVLPLNPDLWMFWSLHPGSAFLGSRGLLSTSGRARSELRLPLVPELEGLSLQVLGIILDPSAAFGVRRWSDVVTIRPFR